MVNVKKWDDRIFDACQESLRGILDSTDRPAVLYHFTDAAGLIGIVRDSSLWASLATSLNDRSEVTYGIELARKVLRGRLERSSSFYLRSILEFLDPANVPDELRLEVRTFVVSFCARIDKSGHWLHYGRSGEGFALGFETNKLHGPPFDLAGVIYHEDQQRRAIERLVDETESTLMGLRSSLARDHHDHATRVAAHMVAAHLWSLAPMLKNPAFGEEEEWRLVTYHFTRGAQLELKSGRSRAGQPAPLPTGYRSVDGRVIPHRIVNFPKTRMPLGEIVLGANVSIDPTDAGLRFLLEEHLPGRSIRLLRSTVPVRR